MVIAKGQNRLESIGGIPPNVRDIVYNSLSYSVFTRVQDIASESPTVKWIKRSYEKFGSVLSLLLYKIVLDLSYCSAVSFIFGFELNLNLVKLAESYLLFFIIFILIPKSSKKLSSLMIWLLILISYIPMLTLFAFTDQSRAYMYAVTGFWILVFLLLSRMPEISISFLRQSQSENICYSIFICSGVVVLFLICNYLGFSFNYDLTEIYEIRSHYVELSIPFAGYVFNWMSYIINPILFALFLTRRKWTPIGLIVFLQILLFSNVGMKTLLLALPFVLALMLIVTRKNPLAWMAAGLTTTIVLGMLSYWLTYDTLALSLFTRRTLMVPARVSFIYYDFFSTNGHTFLSQHRIFRNFLDYPYHLDPPYLIGEFYFDNPKLSANNGIVGDAYMNFGFIGFILWGIVLAIILKFMDIFSEGIDPKIGIAAIAMPSITLTNSALLTNLLTHGLLLALLFLYLLPRKSNTPP